MNLEELKQALEAERLGVRMRRDDLRRLGLTV